MATKYEEHFYDYKVDGDFVAWLDTMGAPPNNLKLVSILPHGSPFVGGQRGGNPDGTVAMRCACYFEKMGP